MYVDQISTIGKGIREPWLALHHQSSLRASLGWAYSPPELKSAVVVLTNPMARSDAANWLG